MMLQVKNLSDIVPVVFLKPLVLKPLNEFKRNKFMEMG